MRRYLRQRTFIILQNAAGKGLLGFVMFSMLVGVALLPAKAQLFNRPPAPVQNQGYGQGGGGDEGSADPASLLLRIDRLENQMRAMNGQIEELQFQLKQSQDQLRKFQGDVEFRFQDLGKGGAAGGGGARPPQKRTDAGETLPEPQQSASLAGAAVPVQNPYQANGAQPNLAQPNGRKSDAFDPSVAPAAPGAPQPLGSSRSASQPLDLTGGAASNYPPTTYPAANQPPPTVISGAGATTNSAVASLGGGASAPREQFTSALNAYNLGQYDIAETGFRNVIAGSPSDRLVPDAYFYLGETYFQRNKPRDAAENFLKVTTDYPKSLHAPEAMLRLGLSLESLGAHQQACATLGDLPNKFPSSPPAVRQSAAREHQHLKC